MNFRDGGRRRRGAAVVDITPLVDVVFQLLIFFLLTSNYVSNDAPAMRVDLPESSLKAPTRKIRDYTIVVREDGQIMVGHDERVDLVQLEIELRKVQARAPDTVVLIRGAQQVPYGRVISIMGLVKAVGLPISAVYRSGG